MAVVVVVVVVAAAVEVVVVAPLAHRPHEVAFLDEHAATT